MLSNNLLATPAGTVLPSCSNTAWSLKADLHIAWAAVSTDSASRLKRDPLKSEIKQNFKNLTLSRPRCNDCTRESISLRSWSKCCSASGIRPPKSRVSRRGPRPAQRDPAARTPCTPNPGGPPCCGYPPSRSWEKNLKFK